MARCYYTTQPCPVCGNDLQVNAFANEFRCKYCRRLIKINAERKKGKFFISLDEVVEKRSKVIAREKRKYIPGLEGR